jgi:site-specific DNA-methyltransferase (adenine-specific)
MLAWTQRLDYRGDPSPLMSAAAVVHSSLAPYYSNGLVSLFHGDCLTLMPELGFRPNVIITDPPYGDTSLDWDRRVQWWQLAYSITAESASLWCFGSFRMFYESPRLDPWKLAQELVWEKHNGSGFHADRFRRVHELFAHFYKGSWAELYKKVVYTNDATARAVRRKTRPPHMGHIEDSAYVSVDGGPRLMRSVLYAKSCHGQAIHPTQKPLATIDPVVEYSCGPNTVALDPFAGSGSVLVACRNRGIHAVGIEIEERFCEAAALRLERGNE